LRLPTGAGNPSKTTRMVTSTGPGRLEYYSRIVSCQVEILYGSVEGPRFTPSSPSGHRQCIERKPRFRQSARVPVRNRCRGKPALPCSPARTLRELPCGGVSGILGRRISGVRRAARQCGLKSAKSCSRMKSRIVLIFPEQFPLQALLCNVWICASIGSFRLSKKIKAKGMRCMNPRSSMRRLTFLNAALFMSLLTFAATLSSPHFAPEATPIFRPGLAN